MTPGAPGTCVTYVAIRYLLFRALNRHGRHTLQYS